MIAAPKCPVCGREVELASLAGYGKWWRHLDRYIPLPAAEWHLARPPAEVTR